MGSRGPLRKPTALRLVDGNPSHRSLPEGEPRPPALLPSMPPDLSPTAVIYWKNSIAVMAKVPGWATQADWALLKRYCETAADWERHKDDVRLHGDTYSMQAPYTEGDATNHLIWKKRPEAVLLKEERADLLRMEAALGFGPAFRTRINIERSGFAIPGEEDPA